MLSKQLCAMAQSSRVRSRQMRVTCERYSKAERKDSFEQGRLIMREKEGIINPIALKEYWRRWNSNASSGMTTKYKGRQLFLQWKRMGAATSRFIHMLHSSNKAYHVSCPSQTAGDIEIKKKQPSPSRISQSSR